MSNYTILIIDYEPRSLELMVNPLKKAGYDVQVANDGIAGLKTFQEIKPNLVIIEAMIPKKHGFEVCQEIKKTATGRRTPVIITTAVYRGRKYRSQALHIYQCDEYLEKPIQSEKLLSVCQELLGAAPDPDEVEEDAPPAPPPKARSTQKARPPRASIAPIVEDLTEQEIIDRLDAILPGEPGGPGTRAVAEAAEATPSLAEPRLSAPSETPPGSVVSATVAGGSQVVPFDTKRAKKRQRKKKQAAAAPTGPHGPARAQALPEPSPKEEPAPHPPRPVRAPARQPSQEEPAPDPPLTPAARPPRQEPAPPRVMTPAARSLPFPEEKVRSWWMEKPWSLIAVVAFGLAVGLLLMVLFGGSEEAAPTEISSTPPAIETPASSPLVQARPSTEEDSPIDLASVSGPAEVAPREPSKSTPPPAKPAEAKPEKRAPVREPPLKVAKTQPPATKSSRTPPRSIRRPTSTPPPPKKVQQEVTPPPKRKPTTRTPATNPGTPVPGTESTIASREKASTDTAPPVKEVVTPKEPVMELPSGALESIKETAQRTTVVTEPARTAERGDLVEFSDLDSRPVVKTQKFPAYGSAARRLEQEGTVILKMLINEEGEVDEVELISGIPGSDLNKASVKAARRWTYQPAMKDGVPVKVWKRETIVFKL